jgi:hypothetical protein
MYAYICTYNANNRTHVGVGSSSHTLSLSHIHTLSLSHTLTLTHTLSHTLSLSLSHTHTHTHTHTLTHTPVCVSRGPRTHLVHARTQPLLPEVLEGYHRRQHGPQEHLEHGVGAEV